MVIFTQLIFIALSTIFKIPNEFNTYLRLVLGVTLLLIILYRPSFISKKWVRNFVRPFTGVGFLRLRRQATTSIFAIPRGNEV